MAIHKDVTGFEEKRVYDLDQRRQARKGRRPSQVTVLLSHAHSVAASVHPTSAACSPTASLTYSSLAMDFHDQKVKYSEQKNKSKVTYN